MSNKLDKAAPLEMVSLENVKRYQVSSRVEILHLFREIKEQRSFIRAFFSDKKHSFLTCLVKIDEEKGIVAFDMPMQTEVSQSLKESEKMIMSTAVNRVQVQFTVTLLSRGKIDGLPVFYAYLPQNIMRLQRREYYRLITPVATPIVCEIPVEVSEEEKSLIEAENQEGMAEEVTEKYQVYNVYDISVGGAAILDIPAEKAGQTIEGVRLHLPDEGMIITSLVIRNVFDVTMRAGNTVRRVGCAFTGLSPAMQKMIQLYILRSERERRANNLKID